MTFRRPPAQARCEGPVAGLASRQDLDAALSPRLARKPATGRLQAGVGTGGQEAIDDAVHWAMGLEDSFLLTAGDLRVLPKMLDAADRFLGPPSKVKMADNTVTYDIMPIFK